MKKKALQKHKKQWYRYWFVMAPAILLAVIGLVLLAFRLSPWPGSLIIRTVFENDAKKVTQALESHRPATPVTRLVNEHYRSGDKDASLDVYYPESVARTDKRLPVVVWTHGGAWLSGSKDNYAVYFENIAAQGFTVIAPNYTLAPAKSYPAQLHQLNDAYKYVIENEARFHADMSKVVLAGDSAGSQLSAQMAAMVTNPDYAQEVGLIPNLTPEQLKGVILFCGIYKMEGLVHPDPALPRIVGWGDDVAVWGYAGTHDFTKPVIRQMSPYYHVTSDFPPAFISGGNNDPLTDAQSKPLAEKLATLGVRVQPLFYEPNHQPGLPHEYQFNLDNEDGKKALEAALQFIDAEVRR